MDPFLGQIEIFAFNFPPRGWALCNGQLLSISQNAALFSLLGTTFGGNGQTTFALPDLRSRVPISFSNNFTMGEQAGQEAHTLINSEMPSHIHSLMGDNSAGATNTPANNTVLGKASGTASPGGGFSISIYSTQSPNNVQYAGSVANNGGSQPHSNLMPYLTLSFCIALQGVFPSRN